MSSLSLKKSKTNSAANDISNESEQNANEIIIEKRQESFFHGSADDIIYDSENKVKAATFPKLIELLTHPNDYDYNFLSDFLLTYRSFAPSKKVIDALIDRYENTKSDDIKLLNSVWIRILNVIKHWIEKCWWDFSKDCPALSDQCNEFLKKCRTNPAISKVAENIQDKLMRKIVGSSHVFTVSQIPPPAPLWTPKEMNIPLLSVNTEELARQLTMIEWNIWSEIQPWEFLGLNWTKKNKETMAPNVLALINRFNSVSGWVAASVLSKESSKKRSKFITKFIEIASILNSMNNFNGVMEIVAGLNRGPVYRLKQSWDLIATPVRLKFEELLTVVDRSKSYASMRKIIRKINPPCIPYLGIYLTDLTFIEEGNKDMMGNLINWNKRHLISETIHVIKQYQLQAYNFKEIPEIEEQLKNLPSVNDDDLYLISEYLELRTGKERGPKPQLLTLMDSMISNLIVRKFDHDEFELDIVKKDYPYFQLDLPGNIEADNTNMIVSGTLPKIIERLTHHSLYDGNSTFGFLIFYRIWTSSHELMDLIISRYKVPLPSNPSSIPKWETEVKSVVEFRTFNLMRSWVDRHFYDFDSDSILNEKFFQFVDLLQNAAQEKSLVSPVPSRQANFYKNITELFEKRRQEYENQKAFFKLRLNLPPIKTSYFQKLSPKKFSQQLTLMQHSLYFKIHPDELLHYAQGSESKATTVLDFLDHCALFEQWIRDQLPVTKKSNIEKLLYLCTELAECNNYVAMQAIINILSKPNPKITSYFQHTIDKFKSLFQNVESVAPPALPPIDTFVKMIIARPELKMPDLVRGKRINFRKYLPHISDIIINFMSYQKQSFFFTPIDEILTFIVQNLYREKLPVQESNAVTEFDDLVSSSDTMNSNPVYVEQSDLSQVSAAPVSQPPAINRQYVSTSMRCSMPPPSTVAPLPPSQPADSSNFRMSVPNFNLPTEPPSSSSSSPLLSPLALAPESPSSKSKAHTQSPLPTIPSPAKPVTLPSQIPQSKGIIEDDSMQRHKSLNMSSNNDIYIIKRKEFLSSEIPQRHELDELPPKYTSNESIQQGYESVSQGSVSNDSIKQHASIPQGNAPIPQKHEPIKQHASNETSQLPNASSIDTQVSDFSSNLKKFNMNQTPPSATRRISTSQQYKAVELFFKNKINGKT